MRRPVARTEDKAARRHTAKMARMTKPRAKGSIVLLQRTKVKPKILMIFTRQLATLIDSGLPLLRSLTVLGKAGARQGIEKDH
jgi:type IV pilus assembly protein PilC